MCSPVDLLHSIFTDQGAYFKLVLHVDMPTVMQSEERLLKYLGKLPLKPEWHKLLSLPKDLSTKLNIKLYTTVNDMQVCKPDNQIKYMHFSDRSYNTL